MPATPGGATQPSPGYENRRGAPAYRSSTHPYPMMRTTVNTPTAPNTIRTTASEPPSTGRCVPSD